MEIDAVIPWVDGSDPKLIEKRNKFSNHFVELNGDERFRDTNLLPYVLKSIEKYASWIHHVYIVTDNQHPSWLKESEKVTVVDHRDFIPSEFLPTFNSSAINLNTFRISGLSEHYLLFNDDMIINDYVNESEFFSKDGLPVDTGIYSVIPSNDDFSHIILNNVIVINKHFGKLDGIKKDWRKFINIKYGRGLIRSLLSLPWSSITGFYNPHITLHVTKSNFEKVWRLEEDVCRKTSQHKFRTSDDISDWLIRYYQIQSANFWPGSVNFGKYFTQNETKSIIQELKTPKHKVICINDVKESNPEMDLPPIIQTLKEKFD